MCCLALFQVLVKYQSFLPITPFCKTLQFVKVSLNNSVGSLTQVSIDMGWDSIYGHNMGCIDRKN